MLVKMIYANVFHLKRHEYRKTSKIRSYIYKAPIFLPTLTEILVIFFRFELELIGQLILGKPILGGGKMIIDDAIEQCSVSVHTDTSSILHIILNCFRHLLT